MAKLEREVAGLSGLWCFTSSVLVAEQEGKRRLLLKLLLCRVPDLAVGRS